jgi:hypothetical protein
MGELNIVRRTCFLRGVMLHRAVQLVVKQGVCFAVKDSQTCLRY